ncbi:hypothetical protein WJR50_26145 [Catalinimonas sp. 4WD22]|uniref:hypothetical protein n=1 Tax=Catalinimonas locisalis TaxID=3133978 RepID=UPI0031015957
MSFIKFIIGMITGLVIHLSSLQMVQAQSVEVTPFSGYSLRSTFDVYGGSMRVYGGHTFGGIFTFNVTPSYGIEVMYSRQSTEADVRSIYLEERGIPAAVVYTMLGGLKQFPVSSQLIPFVGFNLGVAGLIPQTEGYEDVWRFALGVKAGTKFMLSEQIGLRLQAAMNVPVQDFGASFFVGTGGSGVNVGSYSTIFQFTFSGGLVFHLGL